MGVGYIMVRYVDESAESDVMDGLKNKITINLHLGCFPRMGKERAGNTTCYQVRTTT